MLRSFFYIQRICLTIVILFPEVKLCAQICDTSGFQNIYYFKGLRYGDTRKILKDKNGNNYLFGQTFYDEQAYETSTYGLIIKTSKRGTPLWAKGYGHKKNNSLMGIISNENDIICYGETKAKYEAPEAELFCADSNGKVKWGFTVGIDASRITEVIQLSDGGFIARGGYLTDYQWDISHQNIISYTKEHAFLICINADGSKRWFKEYKSQIESDRFTGIIQLKDQSILVNGGSDLHDHHFHGFILKVKLTNGDIIDSKTVGNVIYKMVELPDRSIRLVTYEELIQLDKDLNSVWRRSLKYDLDFYNPPELLKVETNSQNDIAYYFGYLRSGFIPILFKVTDFNKIVWARTYNSPSNIGRNSESAATSFKDNRFGICGRYVTRLLSTGNPDWEEYQTYVIETDADGKTPCASDIQMSVNSELQDNEGLGIENFTARNLTSLPHYGEAYKALSPRHLVDCYSTSCCRDTTLYRSATICEATSYNLPDGTLVTLPDVYTTLLKTYKGCDSVIFTDLTVNKKLSVSLGNDTCMINSKGADLLPIVSDTTANYLWQDGSIKKQFHVSEPGRYTLTVTNKCDVARSSVTVLPNCTLPIYVPNAFTPNHDSRNDVFRIGDMKGQRLITFNIYNRFGQKIFVTSNWEEGWNGTLKNEPQNPGVYQYLITYVDLIGNQHTLKGSFILIR